MADTKITALTALTAADPANDVIPIVDVSDTSMAASGTTKKISVNNILGASGTATLASATITGAATVGTTLGVTGVSTLTGNVGVGVTPSAWTVFKAVELPGGAFASTGGQTDLVSNVYYDGAFRYKTSGIGASILDQFDGTFRWYTATSGTAGAAITAFSTAAMTLNSTGNLVLKGGTAAANGVGVTFPATQVASSDANCLDDYEEGTFTPNIGGTATYTTQSGIYTKIGNKVFFSIRLTVLLVGTGSQTTISGLPFAVGASAGLNSISVGYFASLALSVVYISGFAAAGTSTIVMNASTAATTTITNAPSIIGNATDLILSGFYDV